MTSIFAICAGEPARPANATEEEVDIAGAEGNLLFLAGALAVGVEKWKHGDVELLIEKKEGAIRNIQQAHSLIDALRREKLHPRDKADLQVLLGEIRDFLGEDAVLNGVTTKDAALTVEMNNALSDLLQTKIQDETSQTTVHDMKIAHLLETCKQILEALKKISEMLQNLVDSINRKLARGG